MKCFISRMVIDQKEESGKPLPKMVLKHVMNCSECKTYMNIGKEMSKNEPVLNISEYLIQNLNRKILSNIMDSGNKMQLKNTRNNFFMIPVVAVILILIIIFGIFLLNNNRNTADPLVTKSIFSIGGEKNIKSINELIAKVESPIVREAEELKKSVNFAKDYLRKVVDFKLPGIRN